VVRPQTHRLDLAAQGATAGQAGQDRSCSVPTTSPPSTATTSACAGSPVISWNARR
jgi:hypothetical protein